MARAYVIDYKYTTAKNTKDKLKDEKICCKRRCI